MDVLTLSCVNLFIGVAASLLISLLYRQDPQQRHLLYWLLAGICLAINSLFGITHGSLDSVPYWLVPAAANTSTIGIHLFLLAGLACHVKYGLKLHWLVGIVFITYVINYTDFAQASVVNRTLLNFPIIVALNLFAVHLLLRHRNKALAVVYNSFILAFGFNIAQLSLRYIVLLLDLTGTELTTNKLLIHSVGYFALTTFAMIAFGSCVYLVYRQQHIALQNAAERDALTGVFNRRSLQHRLETELQRCQRSGQSVSIVMFDVDHFKQVNDLYGHVAGDTILRHVADVALKQLRVYDVMFRYGGEEFLLCLPNTDAAAALCIANRLRREIEHSTIPGHSALKLTISVGATTSQGELTDWNSMVRQADSALYQSKQQGRNQAWHFQELPQHDC